MTTHEIREKKHMLVNGHKVEKEETTKIIVLEPMRKKLGTGGQSAGAGVKGGGDERKGKGVRAEVVWLVWAVWAVGVWWWFS